MVIKRDVIFTPDKLPRTLHIYLPDDYEQSDERYPVMYFFDGHNLFYNEDATYGKSWGLREFLDRWEKKMIVVGVECSHRGNQRLREYSPYRIETNWMSVKRPFGKRTMQWFTQELKPMIDSEYRTWAHREATGIAGSSMGGLMSAYSAIAHNDVFSKAACLSSAVSSCCSGLFEDFAAHHTKPDTRVWFSWGETEQWAKPVSRMLADEFNKRGALTRLYEQSRGRHCEADWEKQLPALMDFLWLDR